MVKPIIIKCNKKMLMVSCWLLVYQADFVSLCLRGTTCNQIRNSTGATKTLFNFCFTLKCLYSVLFIILNLAAEGTAELRIRRKIYLSTVLEIKRKAEKFVPSESVRIESVRFPTLQKADALEMS
jgi:hypothetical protein